MLFLTGIRARMDLTRPLKLFTKGAIPAAGGRHPKRLDVKFSHQPMQVVIF
jgi:hypothetical protein